MELLVFVVALFTSTGSVAAVNCYHCAWASNTGEVEACKDPFKTPSTVTANPCLGSSGCLKSVGQVNDVNTISRGCSTESDCKEENCIEDTCYYCCTGDRCNGAVALNFTPLIVAIVAIITCLLTRRIDFKP